MKVMEVVGMMSTGALLTLGGLYLLAPERLGMLAAPTDAAPQTASVQTVAPEAAATPAPAETVEVTRGTTDLSATATGVASTADQLRNIVAVSMEPIERTNQLTDEQLEVIAFFERSAREYNQAYDPNLGAALRFSNMAIDRLNVRYFYVIGADYAEMDRDEVIAEQRASVIENICGSSAIRTLMEDYDFRYTYTYLSADNRQVGEIIGNALSCS